jgi:hypothetical protein
MRGVVTINLGGQPRAISLNNNFILQLGIHLKCEPLNIHARIIDIAEQNPIRALKSIIYCGLCAYQERICNYEHGLTIVQVSEWVDDADQNEFQSIWDEFMEIMGIPKASEEQIEAYKERIKKNVIQTAKPQPTKRQKK